MKIKEGMFNSIASFLPKKIVLSKILEKNFDCSETFNATLLFADIFGFTKMSEKLARLGKEGAEEVNKIINAFFDQLINIIYKWNGDIYRFSGDAFLAFFKEESLVQSTSQRAINASSEILKFVREHPVINTKVGRFKIKIHIGLTKGRVYFQDLQKNYFLGGKIVNDLMNLIEFAGPWEIVVNPVIKNELSDIIFKPKGNLWKYVGMRRKPIAPKIEITKFPLKIIKNKSKILESYIPEWLLKRISLNPHFDHKDGEHRNVAIVFLHFSGIPYDKNHKETQRKLLNFYYILNEYIKKYDGWINSIDVYKDSERILIIFGFPQAYEDEEKRAVLFAYEILNHPELKGLKLKAGINFGSVFAGPIGNEIRREYTILGDAVNLTARLAAKAVNHTVVVTEPIFNKTFGLFDYEFLGAKEYKGKKKKIEAYRLIRKKELKKEALKRWLSESEKIIGREKEIKEIQNLLNLCLQGKGQILSITGEPGVGKSRLVQELIKLSKKAGYQIFQGNCISYGSSFSYHPWVQILADFFGILPEDSIKIRARKIKGKSIAFDKKLINWLPLIGEIMGVPFPETPLTKYLDAKIKKQRIFDVIFDFMRFISKSKPVNIIIEDLQWADSVSIELVNYIGRNIEDKPIFLTLVYRSLKKKEEFMEKKWIKELHLKELSKDESIELVKNLLNVKDIPENLREVVIEKSQGNPFYIEELVKSLIEQGYVVEERVTWKFRSNLKKIELPDTVETVILSRIDLLDLHERDVLQTASVLGREFDKFLLKGIYPNPNILKRVLKNLERVDLIKLEKTGKESKYFFKHVLTQEVAYGTLSFARKQELHRKIGEFIETDLKDRKEEFLGLLSHHFYAGGDYERALFYSVEAGEKARKMYANEEAIEFFTRAIESYKKLEGKV